MALGGNWSTLEKQMKEPLAPALLEVITDTFKFPTMTTVQVCFLMIDLFLVCRHSSILFF
jgi:hypothetical protein